MGEIDRDKEFELCSQARLQYLSSIVLVVGKQPVLQRPHDATKYFLHHHQKNCC